MPNIIEQQDLLKGLPDTRLMTLLQNPVADIPPFLVAAEAQRRQALRQQFAGSENKESVVDSLIKQVSGVPPKISPKDAPSGSHQEAPDLKGIIEKNKEIKDEISAQEETDQKGMAAGGVVRRYAAGGIASLAPKGASYGFNPGIQAETALGNIARASSVIPQTMGVAPGVLGFQARPQQPQQMRGGGMVQRYQAGGVAAPFRGRQGAGGYLPGEEPSGFGAIQKVYDYVTPDITGFLERMRKYGATPSQAQREEMAIEEKAAEPRIFPTIPAVSSAGTTFKPFVPEPGKKDTSEENKTKNPEVPTPQPGETEDEFRARLEALYRTQEPSDWEKAQKWAAMAEQFLDPSKTTMQSVAGAAKAFAEGAGAEQRAAREGQLAREKAMLEYDVGKADTERERASAARSEQIETQKFYAEQAQGQIKAITVLMDDVARNKADYIKNTYPPDAMGNPTSVNPNDPAIQNFDKQLAQLSETLRGYIGQQQGALRGLGGLTKTDPSVLMFTGDGLARFGG